MANRDVNSVDYASFELALADANAGDNIRLYAIGNAVNRDGRRHMVGNSSQITTKAITITGMLPRQQIEFFKIRAVTIGDGSAIDGNGEIIFDNITFVNSTLITLSATGGTVTFKNCIFLGLQTGFSDADLSGATYNFINCIFNCTDTTNYMPFRRGASTAMKLNLFYCGFLIGTSAITAINIPNTSGTVWDIRNCYFLGCVASAEMSDLGSKLSGNSTHNIVTLDTAIGANCITLGTHSGMAFYSGGNHDRDIQETSIAYHTGTPITGITTDMWGRTRHATTPSIGPLEGGVHNPGATNVRRNTKYWLADTEYTGSCAVPSSNHVTSNDMTGTASGLVALSGVMTGVGGTLNHNNVLTTANGNYIDLTDDNTLLSGVPIGVSPRAGTLLFTVPSQNSVVTNTIYDNADKTSVLSGLRTDCNPIYATTDATYGDPSNPTTGLLPTTGILKSIGGLWNDDNMVASNIKINVEFGLSQLGTFIGEVIPLNTPNITATVLSSPSTSVKISVTGSTVGVTNYIYQRDESASEKIFEFAFGLSGDGDQNVDNLVRGEQYTWMVQSKLGDQYSRSAITYTITIPELEDAGEDGDHDGGWYSGISNIPDSTYTNYEDRYSSPHDGGWYTGITDAGQENY